MSSNQESINVYSSQTGLGRNSFQRIDNLRIPAAIIPEGTVHRRRTANDSSFHNLVEYSPFLTSVIRLGAANQTHVHSVYIAKKDALPEFAYRLDIDASDDFLVHKMIPTNCDMNTPPFNNCGLGLTIRSESISYKSIYRQLIYEPLALGLSLKRRLIPDGTQLSKKISTLILNKIEKKSELSNKISDWVLANPVDFSAISDNLEFIHSANEELLDIVNLTNVNLNETYQADKFSVGRYGDVEYLFHPCIMFLTQIDSSTRNFIACRIPSSHLKSHDIRNMILNDISQSVLNGHEKDYESNAKQGIFVLNGGSENIASFKMDYFNQAELQNKNVREEDIVVPNLVPEHIEIRTSDHLLNILNCGILDKILGNPSDAYDGFDDKLESFKKIEIPKSRRSTRVFMKLMESEDNFNSICKIIGGSDLYTLANKRYTMLILAALHSVANAYKTSNHLAKRIYTKLVSVSTEINTTIIQMINAHNICALSGYGSKSARHYSYDQAHILRGDQWTPSSNAPPIVLLDSIQKDTSIDDLYDRVFTTIDGKRVKGGPSVMMLICHKNQVAHAMASQKKMSESDFQGHTGGNRQIHFYIVSKEVHTHLTGKIDTLTAFKTKVNEILTTIDEVSGDED